MNRQERPDPLRLADHLGPLRRRARLARATRAFFEARGYSEVETPCAVRAPGEEVHLRAAATDLAGAHGERLWLQTSPEFAMKRLLAAGIGPIFQLARVWRAGEAGPLHATEFTMLEWYRPGATLAGLMDETERFLRAVLPPAVAHRGLSNALADFERISVAEAFARHGGGLDVLADPGDAAALARRAGVERRPGEDWEDLFFRLMLERVEPHLGRARPTFLTHWPAPLAALARRDPADGRVALRFELYLCGIELANAFDELTDAAELAARFAADRARRHALRGAPDWPLDAALLEATGRLPPCAGAALGFDRLAMLASGAPSIDAVLYLTEPAAGPHR